LPISALKRSPTKYLFKGYFPRFIITYSLISKAVKHGVHGIQWGEERGDFFKSEAKSLKIWLQKSSFSAKILLRITFSMH
jgi:hypothetical protein